MSRHTRRVPARRTRAAKPSRAPEIRSRPSSRAGLAMSPDARIVAALVIAAVLVRLPHLGWGLPIVEEEALPMKKAFAMWGWSQGHIDWNPRTAGWPSLSFYVQLLAQRF